MINLTKKYVRFNITNNLIFISKYRITPRVMYNFYTENEIKELINNENLSFIYSK